MTKRKRRSGFVPATVQLEGRALMSMGVNMNFNSPYDGDPEWVDISHAIKSWGPYSNVWDGTTQIKINSMGYPLVNASTFVGLGDNPNGVYQFSYSGAGTFTFGGAAKLQGPVVLGSDGVSRGSVLVDKSLAGQLIMYVSNVDANNPLHDLHLIVPGYSADTTQVYTDSFLQKLQPFATIRTMNWSMTNTATEANWADRTQPGSWALMNSNEVSWEDIIELGNEAHKNIWINVPALATDDYVQQLAQLVHSKLDPSLTVHVEYSNETWNTAFPQYQQVLNAAKSNPLVDQTTDFGKVAQQSAYRLMQISQIFQQAFGADQARAQVEFGAFAGVSSFASTGLAFINSKFGSPSQYFSAVAIAPYIVISSSVDTSSLTLNSLFSYLNQNLTGSYINSLNAHKALADQYGLSLDAYEGGQALDAMNGMNYNLKLQAQTDPRMGQLYTAMLKYWDQYAGGDFLHYTLNNIDSKYGFWGLLQHTDDVSSVKWDAVMSYILDPGDANQDGQVNWSDFLILNANYGKTGATLSQGDFNGDGVVDIADLNLMKSNMNYASLTPDQVAQLAVYGQQAPAAWSYLAIAQVAQSVATQSATIAAGTALVFDAYGSSYVGDMSPTTVKNGSGAIGINKLTSGAEIRTGGYVAYGKGVSTYGTSQVDIALNGAYNTFQADIGLDVTSGFGAAAIFQVWADGVLLYTSPPVVSNATYIPISVDVTSRTTLSLQVTSLGTASAAATVADWAAARVSKVPAGSAGNLSWQVSLGGAVISTLTADSFTFRPLTTGVYTVKAIDTASSGTGSASMTANVGIRSPGNVTATPGMKQITLNWTTWGGSSYVIYRGLTSSPSSLSLYKSGITSLSYVDTNVITGMTYYYAVAAVTADGIQGPLTGITIATSFKPGDATQDGQVDWSDFLALSANYGKSGMSWSQGDFNGDRVVDIADLGLLKTFLNYASITSAQVAQLAVYGQQAPAAWSYVTSTQVAQNTATQTATIAAGTALVFDAYGSSYVGDMNPTTVKNGSGAIGINKLTSGAEIRTGGYVAYGKGVSTYGTSQVDIALNGVYNTFQADIGLDVTSGFGAAATFQVWADGVLLYTSPLVTSNATYIPISVDVTSRTTLSLRVTSSGTASAAATIADWASARVSKVPGGSAGPLTWQVWLNGSVISTTVGTSLTLRPTTTGAYTVKAFAKVGTVTGSSSAAVNVGIRYPGTLSVTPASRQIGLSWTTWGGASYVIYRGLTSSPSSLSLYKSGITSLSYVDTNVTTGTTYYYAVAAVTADGIQGPLSWVYSGTAKA